MTCTTTQAPVPKRVIFHDDGRVQCDCEEFGSGYICKHIMAVLKFVVCRVSSVGHLLAFGAVFADGLKCTKWFLTRGV